MLAAFTREKGPRSLSPMTDDGNKRQRTSSGLDLDLSAQRQPESAAAVLRVLAEEAEASSVAFDTYGTGATLQAFEAEVAALLGKEAAAFFPTGTCAQQSALCALTTGAGPIGDIGQPTIMLHATSHLVYLDCLRDGANQLRDFDKKVEANLPEFDVRAVGEMCRSLRLPDVEAAFDSFSLIGALAPLEPAEASLRPARRSVHSIAAIPASHSTYAPARPIQPTHPRVPFNLRTCASAGACVLVIELPQRMNGGATVPFDELEAISVLCRERGVRLHCDGARLWEVAGHYDKSYPELCALFDSIYVSFYKGVGALSGAMLLGPPQLITDAKIWQKRRGSNAFTFGPAALSCRRSLRRALDGTDLGFADRFQWLQRAVKTVQRLAASSDAALFFDPPIPQSAMVHCYLHGEPELLEACHTRVREVTGVRLWNQIRGRGHGSLPQMKEFSSVSGERWCYFEWSAGPANATLSEDVVSRGWTAFFSELSLTHSAVAAAAP